MNDVKEKRITADVEAQAEKLRTRLSRIRKRLMKADDQGKSLEPYQREIARLKKQLAKLLDHWQIEFSIEWSKRNKNGDYVATCKYHNRIETFVVSKDDDTTVSKPWWCSDVTGHFKTLKEAKNAVLEDVKYTWKIN